MSIFIQIFTTIVSILAFLLSLMNFWLINLRRGCLKATQAPLIYFGYDPGQKPKISVRTLLFSTSARGLVVETMYAEVTCQGTTSRFGFWGHGETGKLTFGGLFVGQTGSAIDSHFVLSQGEKHDFREGQNYLKIFARLVGKNTPVQLLGILLTIPDSALFQLAETGIFFELDPNTYCYNLASNGSLLDPTAINLG